MTKAGPIPNDRKTLSRAGAQRKSARASGFQSRGKLLPSLNGDVRTRDVLASAHTDTHILTKKSDGAGAGGGDLKIPHIPVCASPKSHSRLKTQPIASL